MDGCAEGQENTEGERGPRYLRGEKGYLPTTNEQTPGEAERDRWLSAIDRPFYRGVPPWCAPDITDVPGHPRIFGLEDIFFSAEPHLDNHLSPSAATSAGCQPLYITRART